MHLSPDQLRALEKGQPNRVQYAVELADGNAKLAAELLGVDPVTLRHWLRRDPALESARQLIATRADRVFAADTEATREALLAAGGNLAEAARELGISYVGLQLRLRERPALRELVIDQRAGRKRKPRRLPMQCSTDAPTCTHSSSPGTDRCT